MIKKQKDYVQKYIDSFPETLNRQSEPLKPVSKSAKEYETIMWPLGKEYETTNDPVNKPSHYTFGKYEVINVIEDWGLSFHLANCVKYIARAGKKNPDKEIEDLEKAEYYLKRYINLKKGDLEK